jgi:hypothetical protein
MVTQGRVKVVQFLDHARSNATFGPRGSSPSTDTSLALFSDVPGDFMKRFHA